MRPLSSKMLMNSRPWRLPVVKSLGSCAGVTWGPERGGEGEQLGCLGCVQGGGGQGATGARVSGHPRGDRCGKGRGEGCGEAGAGGLGKDAGSWGGRLEGTGARCQGHADTCK